MTKQSKKNRELRLLTAEMDRANSIAVRGGVHNRGDAAALMKQAMARAYKIMGAGPAPHNDKY